MKLRDKFYVRFFFVLHAPTLNLAARLLSQTCALRCGFPACAPFKGYWV
ncbi:hypothetical protein AXX16_2611 [Serratia rubidaea]|nr:hypothetical protein AXX16_2611 [Serratia rubidaea]